MAKLTDLYVNIGAKTDGLDRGIAQSESKLKGFSAAIGGIGKAIAGAFAVSAIAAFVGALSQAALGADEVEAGFRRLNEPLLLQKLRAAVSGTVSDLNLMKAAVRAENIGIPIRQLGAYFEFAERRAGELNSSTEALIESLITGIGNKSTRAFKELGISAIEVQKKFKEIDPALMSVQEVSDRVFLLINDELGKMGEGIDSVSDKLERNKAEWSNVKTEVGKLANEFKSVFAPVISGAANGLRRFLTAFGAVGMDPGKIAVMMKQLKMVDGELENAAILEEERIRAEELAEVKRRVAEADRLRRLKEEQKEQEKLNKLRAEINANLGQHIGLGKSQTDVKKPLPLDISEVNLTKELPDLDKFNDVYDNIEKRNEDIRKSFEVSKISAKEFGDTLINIGAQSDSLKEYASAALSAARQFVAAKLAEVVAQQIANAIKSSGGNPYVALAVGAAVGGATAAMFNSVVPKLAKGAIVTQPTLAMIGEKGPEAVIPLNKMKGQDINIHGVVRGKDLYWTIQNYNNFLSKTT